jgi:hypothetical protein
MYWVSMVQPPTIESAAMDGTDRRTLISTSLGKPDPLFIDVDDETLYWADGVLHLIESFHPTLNKTLMDMHNECHFHH